MARAEDQLRVPMVPAAPVPAAPVPMPGATAEPQPAREQRDLCPLCGFGAVRWVGRACFGASRGIYAADSPQVISAWRGKASRLTRRRSAHGA